MQMTLLDLKNRIEEELRHDPRAGEKLIGVAVVEPSIGGTPVVGVANAKIGFDWDGNTFIITPNVGLTRKTVDIVENELMRDAILHWLAYNKASKGSIMYAKFLKSLGANVPDFIKKG